MQDDRGRVDVSNTFSYRLDDPNYVEKPRNYGKFYRTALVALGLGATLAGSYMFGRFHGSPEQSKTEIRQQARSYTVQPGDTLGRIAQTYNVSLDELVSLNGISNPDVIQVGYRLKLPSEQTTPRVKTRERFPLDYEFLQHKVAKLLPKGTELAGSWIEGDLDGDGNKDLALMTSSDRYATYSWDGSQYAHNSNVEDRILSASGELQTIARSSYSDSEKRSRMYDVQRSYGEALTLVAVRMFPVRDPDDGRWKPFDAYMREFVGRNTDESFRGTPMGRDPVGVAFDMMTGRYKPDEWVRDHMSDIGGSGGGRYASSGIEVIETYPGKPGQEWSKVRTPTGVYYRDPRGGLHYGMGSPPIDTKPEIMYIQQGKDREYVQYRDPITGRTWMESRPAPQPEYGWRTVKTEQRPGYPSETTETKIWATEPQARDVRMSEGIKQGNERVLRDINTAVEKGREIGGGLVETGKSFISDLGKRFGGQ